MDDKALLKYMKALCRAWDKLKQWEWNKPYGFHLRGAMLESERVLAERIATAKAKGGK